MTTLFYSLIRTQGEDAEIHPQKMMMKLGITYEEAEPIPIMDGWFFFNCQNIPDDLPYFLNRGNLTYKEFIDEEGGER